MNTLPRLLAGIGTLLACGLTLAGPAEELAGAWECRLPGVEYASKPPIVWFGPASIGGAGQTVEVDGFTRAVAGTAELVPDEGGWWRVQPGQGAALLVQPQGVARTGAPVLLLKRSDAAGTYRCVRVQAARR
jgi:hypothetical protein